MGAKVTPALSVLNRPPVPVPTKNCAGFPGTRVISLIRPPMFAGPMERQASERMRSVVTGEASPDGAAAFFFEAAAHGPGGGCGVRLQARQSVRMTRAD